MPLDAVCLTALKYELEPKIVGARIDRIYQPERDELVFALRSERGGKLLLSANPSRPRVHLTALARENPAAPPMFCMLMRKHLLNGKIAALRQPPVERILELEIDTTDELGEPVRRTLAAEMVGRSANLILLDGERRIIDCLRRISPDDPTRRRVLPGLFYHLPPALDKRSLFKLGEGELRELLGTAPLEKTLDQWLLDTFAGLSPLVCREICQLGTGRTDSRLCELDRTERERFFHALTGFQTYVAEGRFTPWLLKKDGKGADFSYLPITQYGPAMELCRRESFSVLLDEFYGTKELQERIRQRGADLIRAATAARDRTARKLALQAKEYEATQGRERLRQMGDIVTANLYRMERGMAKLTAQDFFHPETAETEIRLDPLLTPQQNAARYYKDYNKAKNAEKFLSQQMKLGRTELEYLNSILEEIARAEGERELQEIRQEMADAGYLRRIGTGKKEKRVASRPRQFRSTAGFAIEVGKNNRQNDELTLKTAWKTDLWLHVQKIHGSHVIVHTEGKTPDERTVTEAAVLAAWYSQAREGQNVPVDYTPVKYVKKPAGGRPGMVIYTTYRTAYVTPEEETVKRLRTE